ncbi:DNA-binding transcriptional activator [Desulfamplus magnetovallimortis]|uniref:DNA-binding transcriptional activator n=1 Tax=Desulfamplus magnetovallimortis TaxID=1246637 RepID=A0A1W1H7F6_9BACT|nr:phage shock protein operon transcriptional activator [Desulfamplus magnetovallimortis]SLM28407.1 DNA-binding transcriptional activator [Desulfamplus magnetovallimortis]
MTDRFFISSPSMPISSLTMGTPEAMGQSEAFLDFQERLSRVAPVNRPVLILGERGTGKELAATRLHFLSRRWQGPFITLNCASLSPTLLEAELFGHAKGAFTGAHQRRKGRFETADKGTLFLDEIATIPIVAQEKILRAVEYGSFEPVGSSSSIEVDVRIISATNADLEQMAKKGYFMQDLLDRLSFEVLFLPPLRKRGEDILILANHFARRMAVELAREEIPVFTSNAEKKLMNHTWKGNIRELKNVIERAVYRTDTHVINEIIFNPFISPYDDGSFNDRNHVENRNDAPINNQETNTKINKAEIGDLEKMPLKDAIKVLEISMLNKALKASMYNQKEAALHLGLSYDQLRGLIRKYKNDLFPTK